MTFNGTIVSTNPANLQWSGGAITGTLTIITGPR